jgi:hypothetical protein
MSESSSNWIILQIKFSGIAGLTIGAVFSGINIGSNFIKGMLKGTNGD